MPTPTLPAKITVMEKDGYILVRKVKSGDTEETIIESEIDSLDNIFLQKVQKETKMREYPNLNNAKNTKYEVHSAKLEVFGQVKIGAIPPKNING